MGGTGKTPVTIELIREIQKRGFSCGVISRGYKREQKGVLEVDLSAKAAQSFGDEPSLIKATFPDIPVMVGERRVDAAKALLAAKPVDFILCDDAFQHRRLHRDLNVLLIDATEPQSNYRVLPVGRARESYTPALQRADFIIVTKANQVSNEHLNSVIEWIKSRSSKPILTAGYAFKGLKSLSTGKIEPELKDAAYLITGVAKPEAVEHTIKGHVRIVKHQRFPDHHRYANREIEEILDESSHLQARWLLTTAKDSMKLAAFPKLRDRMWIVELGLDLKGEVKAFYEAIDRLARSSH